MGSVAYIGLVICVSFVGNSFCAVPIERGSNPWTTSYAGQARYLQIQYYCTFSAPEVGSVAGGQATVRVTFDQNVQDIQNWNMLTVSPSTSNRPAKVFTLTNVHTTDFSYFRWSFHGIWYGSITSWGPPVITSTPVPTGTCELITGNGQKTTTTTTTAAAPTTTTTTISTTTTTTPTTTTTASSSPALSVPIEKGSNPWVTQHNGQGGYLIVQYYCTFLAPEVGYVPSGEATVRVTFNQNVYDITNWNLLIETPGLGNRPALVYTLSNPAGIDFSYFRWSFQGVWQGSITSWGPPVLTSTTVPTGTCELITGNGPVTTPPPPVTTTRATSASTSQSAATTNAPQTTTTTTTGNQPTTTVPTIDQTPDICRTYLEVQTFQTLVDILPDTYPYNYFEVLCKSILFFEAQRSGPLPTNQRVTWRKDSALDDGQWGSINRDLVGGWYDAGDLVKYGFPMASSATVLLWGFLQYRNAYDMAGQTEYMYDSIKWPLDYFLKLWDEQNNRFYAQVGDGSIDHSIFERPEDMTSDRPVYYNDVSRPGSDVAAETASAMAIGYLVFKDRDATYANQLLDKAKKIYAFAYNNRGKYSDYISDAATFYRSGGYEDELTQAGVWLYHATGTQSYLTQAESFTRNDYAWSYSWDLKEVAANILLYNATSNSNKKVTCGNYVRNFLRRWSRTGDVPYTPGGLVYRNEWGSLRYAANAAFAALLAQDMGIISQADIDSNTALDPEAQLHYILGDNPASLSYVVGFGSRYPKRPHHKSSFCAPAPAPQCTFSEFHSTAPHYYLLYGAMVGGPDTADQYDDNRANYQRSEVACDYNAGLQSALAGLINRKVV